MRRNMWRVGLFVVTLLACSPMPVSAQFQLELFSNNGTSTLASGISSGATSLTVASGHGARFPSPTGGQYMWITLEESGTVEILKCTARATDTISGCTRAQQSTSASAFTTAANVYLAPTAGTMANIRALTALPFVVTSATAELSAEVTTLPAANGGSGATTLTGLLQGNGTSAFTGITNSSTVGQILRVTGASTYAWGALNLADTDAVTGVLPAVNFATGTPTGSKFLRDDQVWTVIAGGGDALVANPLSQFAATTSAQLLGVISNETGTGALVFASTPTLVTPVLGVATATSVAVDDLAYNATTWNGSLLAPTRNAVRDILETFVSFSDPGAHRLWGWDDTTNLPVQIVIGSGLTFTQATSTLTASGAGLPAADTTSIVEGSADGTKEIRFEVDGLTTGTVRVITVPDSNLTLPVYGYVVTYAGLTANRTITLPDEAFTVVGLASTQTLTNKTLDAEGTGNVVTVPMKVMFNAGVCQNATASLGFSTPTTLGAVAGCHSVAAASGDPAYGFATFPTGGANTEVHGQFELTSDFTGTISAKLKFNAVSITANDVVWQIKFGCTATGEAATAISFNNTTFAAVTNLGTTLQFNTTAETNLTTTGCAASETAFFVIDRDTDTAGDTLDADVQLISATFTVRRAL